MRKASALLVLVSGFFILISLVGVSVNDANPHRQKLLEQYSAAPAPIIQGSPLTPIGSNKAKAVLRIPVLGKNWVQPIVAGVGPDVLDSGVLGRFPESTVPGGRGNYSLTGHRVTHGEPFRYLTNAKVGNKVYLDSAGYRYVYKVTKIFVVNYHDVDVLLPVDNSSIITLITCDSYTSHTDDRFVVRGVLVDKEAI